MEAALHLFLCHGELGACSVDCGGTQTRTVTCQRRDATNSNLDVQTVADSFCAAHGLTKPTTSQSCNTQSCTECKGQGSYGSGCNGAGVEYGIGHYHGQITMASLDFYSTKVYWNSVVVASGDTYMDSLTSGGYVYTKNGTSQIDYCSTGEPTVQWHEERLYPVCRTPI
ncbi:thrombospondin type-1 domain-containing protein [Bilophila wadsworthia]|uniref:thrombospondin type-1 domain-containing protein n=1 Tax=Bilophila wadsworthia TaxID=35833 RepID=UPI003520A0EA